MPIDAVKEILSAVAFGAFALKWSMNWNAEGWFGHSFTVSAVFFAATSLVMAVVAIASSPN